MHTQTLKCLIFANFEYESVVVDFAATTAAAIHYEYISMLYTDSLTINVCI